MSELQYIEMKFANAKPMSHFVIAPDFLTAVFGSEKEWRDYAKRKRAVTWYEPELHLYKVYCGSDFMSALPKSPSGE